MNGFGQPIKTTTFSISGMAGMSGMAGISKPHIFEHYTTVLQEFKKINTFESFTQCTQIQPNELMAISNTITESVAKMAEISEFFIRKTNDVSISTSICDRLQRMDTLHHDALSLIYKFSSISSDIFEATRTAAAHNFTPEHTVVAYMNFDIVNRYRVMNAQLEEIFRRLIVYATLLKDKV
jgi:hypothetical protein